MEIKEKNQKGQFSCPHYKRQLSYQSANNRSVLHQNNCINKNMFKLKISTQLIFEHRYLAAINPNVLQAIPIRSKWISCLKKC